ncbi:quinone oxidoreductase family protein [Aquabacterium humicola]|uniref:quinone oxidoreductase family protein n=1 Tax=Aquabacterium humicola TaxID=3237377 RepID=UPI0025432330|nr:zinc-binding dehydrogenase [Rubrivivax pictus]
MKAALFREFGPASVLKLEDVRTPQAQAGNVLIKVLASGVNRLEVFLRQGTITRDIALPHVLGSDACGVIADVGPGVTGFATGDRVIPMPGYPLDERDDGASPLSAAPSYAIGGILRWGTYAEYVEVPARWVVKDPTDLTPAQVATLPMVLVTGVRAVRTVGQVRAGDHVLIQAGAAGTSTFSIQLAKSLGARVATTVDSDAKIELVKRLGADLVVDVRRDDFVKQVIDWSHGRGADVTIDNLGGAVLQRSIDATRVGGTVVTMGFVTGNEATFKVREFFFAHKTLRGTLMGDLEEFKWGLAQVAQGRIKPVLDRAFALADAAAAHELVGANGALGNVVLVNE